MSSETQQTSQGVRDLNGRAMDGRRDGRKSITCTHQVGITPTYRNELVVLDARGVAKTTRVVCCSLCNANLCEDA